jgi:hypothetical protein
MTDMVSRFWASHRSDHKMIASYHGEGREPRRVGRVLWDTRDLVRGADVFDALRAERVTHNLSPPRGRSLSARANVLWFSAFSVVESCLPKVEQPEATPTPPTADAALH